MLGRPAINVNSGAANTSGRALTCIIQINYTIGVAVVNAVFAIMAVLKAKKNGMDICVLWIKIVLVETPITTGD